jgi:hypothetical protein
LWLLLEQQADCTCTKEQQARRIEETGRFRVEQALVEGPRALQVIGVLCDLNDLNWVSLHGSIQGLEAAASVTPWRRGRPTLSSMAAPWYQRDRMRRDLGRVL